MKAALLVTHHVPGTARPSSSCTNGWAWPRSFLPGKRVVARGASHGIPQAGDANCTRLSECLRGGVTPSALCVGTVHHHCPTLAAESGDQILYGSPRRAPRHGTNPGPRTGPGRMMVGLTASPLVTELGETVQHGLLTRRGRSVCDPSSAWPVPVAGIRNELRSKGALRQHRHKVQKVYMLSAMPNPIYSGRRWPLS